MPAPRRRIVAPSKRPGGTSTTSWVGATRQPGRTARVVAVPSSGTRPGPGPATGSAGASRGLGRLSGLGRLLGTGRRGRGGSGRRVARRRPRPVLRGRGARRSSGRRRRRPRSPRRGPRGPARTRTRPRTATTKASSIADGIRVTGVIRTRAPGTDGHPVVTHVVMTTPGRATEASGVRESDPGGRPSGRPYTAPTAPGSATIPRRSLDGRVRPLGVRPAAHRPRRQPWRDRGAGGARVRRRGAGQRGRLRRPGPRRPARADGRPGVRARRRDRGGLLPGRREAAEGRARLGRERGAPRLRLPLRERRLRAGRDRRRADLDRAVAAGDPRPRRQGHRPQDRRALRAHRWCPARRTRWPTPTR